MGRDAAEVGLVQLSSRGQWVTPRVPAPRWSAAGSEAGGRGCRWRLAGYRLWASCPSGVRSSRRSGTGWGLLPRYALEEL